MKICKKNIILFLFILGSFSAYTQTVFNFKFGYLGVHPGPNPNFAMYENKISPDGLFVAEPSLWFGLEFFLREDYFSAQIYQGFMSDAAARTAGFSYIGLKIKLYQIGRGSFYAELGTNYSYRQNWNTSAAGYIPENNYIGTGAWQYKWVWLSGGLSYYYYLTKKHDISLTTWYGHYDNTFTFMLGYRFWFSTIFKHPKPCKCPFDKFDKKYKH